MSDKFVNYNTSTIAEMNNGIILSSYKKVECVSESYQTESQLEMNLIKNLENQGYERLIARSNKDLYKNLRVQIERLNDVKFSDEEWSRLLVEYLDCPNDGLIEKTRKIQENHIYDFVFDDGHVQNIKIIDKKNIHNNFYRLLIKSLLKVRRKVDMMLLFW